MRIGLVLPHQLFEQNILLSTCDTIYLVEEHLFFKQFRFHKQKIAFHRASMKFYEQYLLSKKIHVVYIEAHNELSDIRKLITYFHTKAYPSFEYIDTIDYWIEQRIDEVCLTHAIKAHKRNSPSFMNTQEDNAAYFSDKRRFFQTDYYKFQRKQRNILIDDTNKPTGGQWTYDEENRQKYPANAVPPIVEKVKETVYSNEAKQYVEKYFPDHYGLLNADFNYPATFTESKQWLTDFLETRFMEFGAYEDAIVTNQHVLHHSLLSPLLNAGLLTPEYVVDQALEYANNHSVPLNSLEGFIRQIVGWREFIRAVYEMKGKEERTKNFWGFTRKIPASCWTGTTGIFPLDCTIKKVLETGYCHHIERLMVIGNFMVLCEFDPDEVYA